MDHPGLEEMGRQAGPEEPGGGGHEGPQARGPGREKGRGPAGGGVDVSGEATEQRWAGGRERQDRTVEAGLDGEGPQVVGGLVHVPFPRHDHQERRLGDQEGEQRPRRAGGSGEGDSAALDQDGPRLLQQVEVADRRQPAQLVGSAHVWRMRSTRVLVERPETRGTRTTRPPAPSTSARPTIASRSQSAPFTRTSGRSERITARGVGSS